MMNTAETGGNRRRAAAVLLSVLFCLLLSSASLAATKPSVAAQGAALYNATTGEFLYEKNGDQQFYPASITKLMTALLVLERCSQDETVVFSKTATTNLEAGAVALDVTEGDQISVRDCLFGLLLKSANEVANGLAEHVSGSVPAFADLMNERARQLGCKSTSFRNPNGLNNAEHLTTPKDMCLIGAACFANPAFLEIDKNVTYHFPATIKRPDGTTLTMGHKMINPRNSQYYPGILGGKTGYTRKAGNTLVTGVERDGVRLVVCVMKSASTHYADTKALLDYGFALEAEKKAAGGSTGASVQPAADVNSAANSAAAQETGSAAQDASQAAGPGVKSASGEALTGPGAALQTAAETSAPETSAPAETTAYETTSPAESAKAGTTAAGTGQVTAAEQTTVEAPPGESVAFPTSPAEHEGPGETHPAVELVKPS